ncbi:hypothetical protein A3A67_04000 [Candidatus Peribacteria bacterium RIFCSPLOWO2_01_FULL_51_18]|nr:MAG: hypothetical protein A3C52_05430 [Candidatus Peribacteria bacterium RIFCSPHIGHO2_02_FULL_51_15]OGJ66787.1 MAG: hypothetical protein A3A67_04000 [Candidatus Peribacteria bacterium RIFCSPLOWO2_01_FULL_51_18]OGJ68427.1 MAG: hypothetical protein A3J34_00465 [Candidatus Peribacteria bacterium RIFCSPLOWO2_02_FULL_51_10]HLD71892.1 hypothetical protein [Candidatus Peribacteraceae bacterium]
MDFGTPIDPKAFPSYEEYQKALKLSREFEERVGAVNEVMSTATSEEEECRGMEALGFTYHDDGPCERSLCQKREECLWCSLLAWQEECDEYFFGGLLSDDDRLIPDAMKDLCLSGEGCDALPVSWHQSGTKEHAAIVWFLDIMFAVFFEASGDLPFKEFHHLHPEIDDWMRHAYFAVLHVTRGRPWPDSENGRKRIVDALTRTDILSAKKAETLLTSFHSFCG